MARLQYYSPADSPAAVVSQRVPSSDVTETSVILPQAGHCRVNSPGCMVNGSGPSQWTQGTGTFHRAVRFRLPLL